MGKDDLVNEVSAYWRAEVERAHDRVRAAVQEDAAARGVSGSSVAVSAIRGIEATRGRLMEFIDLAEQAADGDALALLRTPPPIPLGWQLTPMVASTAAAFARAMADARV